MPLAGYVPQKKRVLVQKILIQVTTWKSKYKWQKIITTGFNKTDFCNVDWI